MSELLSLGPLQAEQFHPKLAENHVQISGTYHGSAEPTDSNLEALRKSKKFFVSGEIVQDREYRPAVLIIKSRASELFLKRDQGNQVEELESEKCLCNSSALTILPLFVGSLMMYPCSSNF